MFREGVRDRAGLCKLVTLPKGPREAGNDCRLQKGWGGPWGVGAGLFFNFILFFIFLDFEF